MKVPPWNHQIEIGNTRPVPLDTLLPLLLDYQSPPSIGLAAKGNADANKELPLKTALIKECRKRLVN
jgi:hypothetical protein